jgi:transcription elongation factor Elf1
MSPPEGTALKALPKAPSLDATPQERVRNQLPPNPKEDASGLPLEDTRSKIQKREVEKLPDDTRQPTGQENPSNNIVADEQGSQDLPPGQQITSGSSGSGLPNDGMTSIGNNGVQNGPHQAGDESHLMEPSAEVSLAPKGLTFDNGSNFQADPYIIDPDDPAALPMQEEQVSEKPNDGSIEAEIAKLDEAMGGNECPQAAEPISEVTTEDAGCPGAFDPASVTVGGKSCRSEVMSLNTKINEYNDFLKACQNGPSGDHVLASRLEDAQQNVDDEGDIAAKLDDALETTRLAAEARDSENDRLYNKRLKQQQAQEAAIAKRNREIKARNLEIARQNVVRRQQPDQPRYQQGGDEELLGAILGGVIGAAGAHQSYSPPPRHSSGSYGGGSVPRRPQYSGGPSSPRCQGPSACSTK